MDFGAKSWRRQVLALRALPGRGLGYVALRRVRRGEVLLEDEALCSCQVGDGDVQEHVSAMLFMRFHQFSSIFNNFRVFSSVLMRFHASQAIFHRSRWTFFTWASQELARLASARAQEVLCLTSGRAAKDLEAVIQNNVFQTTREAWPWL